MRTLLFLLSILICLASSYELARRHQARNFLILEANPLDLADTLLAQKRWREARYLADFVATRPELGELARAQSITLAAETALDFLPIQIQAFLQGVISGEANNTASLLGAVTLDLFVIGDVRDILVQGYKEFSEQNGDKIILALSATGLSLSLLPAFHWAPAIVKGMKRTDAFSESMIRTLNRLAHKAIKTGEFEPLAKVVTNFGRVIERLGLGPAKGAMQAIHSEADLAKLARAASFDANQSYAISTLGGQHGIQMLNYSGKNVSSIAQKIKYSSRLAKVAKKSFGVLPSGFVLMVLLLSMLSLIRYRPLRRQ